MYLIPSDFKLQIQTDNLQQVINSDPSVLSRGITTAIEKIQSALVQKYDLAQELQDTPAWDKTKIYQMGNRVYLTAPLFDATQIYLAGALVVYSNNVYSSIAGSAAHAFVPAEWTLIAANFQTYYAAPPYPIFNVYSPYKVGDRVFWKGNAYTCNIASVFDTFPANIQPQFYENIPNPNVFPDDINSGVRYWGVPVPVTIPANTLITDATKWTIGDNRSQMLVMIACDIALYHVHSRIAPRNIPDLRIKRYDDAIRELKGYANGDSTANLPVLQPRQGARIRYGGQIKNNNSY